MLQQDEAAKVPVDDFDPACGEKAANRALAALTKRGHPTISSAGDVTRYLSGEDITKLHLKAVGKRLSKVTAAAAYARQDLALADIETSELHRKISTLEAMLNAGHSDKAPKWRAVQALRRDPRWKKLASRHAVASAKRGLLESLVESLDARAALLSREISRRALETKVDL